MTKYIRGSGGGGKGGDSGGSAPKEDPDSLRSKQFAKILDVLSEGEIYGLVNGMKSIYLNDTPLQNADDSFNFSGISYESRNGTQAQTYIQGYPSAESEFAVGVQVTYDTPVVRTITNSNVNAARVTVSVPTLTFQSLETGNLKGTSVQLKFELQSNGGGYVEIPIQKTWVASGQDLAEFSGTGYGSRLVVDFTHTRIPVTEDVDDFEVITYLVEYIGPSDSDWITLESGTIEEGTGSSIRGSSSREFVSPLGDNGTWQMRVSVVSGGSVDSSEFFVYDYTSTLTIDGKTTTTYQRSLRLELTGDAPWDIRVSRVTPDSEQSNLRNDTYWSSYTEVIDAKLSYPNSALIGITLDAEQFSSVPTRGYEVKGMLVKIPDNYDPLTREYTGAWGGEFTVDWTNNPAWCFYDLLTNDRYGLGAYISEDVVDKWALYQIAQYCDELVDDGSGFAEPRFTCNLYLQTREEAFKVLQDMASISRGLLFWGAGSITAVQDAPSDPVALFTPANVVGGAFNYQGSSLKSRHTVALVSWNDPQERFKQKIEYVEDVEGIEQFGIVQTEVIAFGCTSRGQAHRLGRAILYAEKMETEVIGFRCGMDSAFVTPGDIIQTTDPVRSGGRMGGRVVSATASVITLDQVANLSADVTNTLWCVLEDGTVESRTVSTVGATNTLTVSSAFSSAPMNFSIWVLGSSTLVPESWRVVSIAQAEMNTVDITAVAYRSDKYAAIEEDLILEPLQTSNLRAIPDPPSNISVTEDLFLVSPVVVGTRMTIGWESDQPSYRLQYRLTGGNWTFLTVYSSNVDIEPVDSGVYEIKVAAVNALGVVSSYVSTSATITGLRAIPADVQNFYVSALSGNALFSWSPATDLDVIVGGYLKIKHTPELISPSWNDSIEIGNQIPGNSTNASLPLISGTYLAKWVDSTGNESNNATAITTNAPNLISMNFIADLEQSPGFLGLKDGVEISGSAIQLIDELAGTYFFDEVIDLGSIQTSRITGSVTSIGFEDSLISERGLVSTWTSVAGSVVTGINCQIFIRQTDDDPDVLSTSDASWSDWAPFIVGDYLARGFQFKAVLSRESTDVNISVSQLSIQVDMPDRVDSGEDIASGTTTLSQSFNFEFKVVPAINITAQNMATGDYYVISNKSTTGFDIIFKNSGGSGVDRTFDYIARAY